MLAAARPQPNLTLLDRLDEAREHLDAGRALALEMGAEPLIKAADGMDEAWRARGGGGPAPLTAG